MASSSHVKFATLELVMTRRLTDGTLVAALIMFIVPNTAGLIKSTSKSFAPCYIVNE